VYGWRHLVKATEVTGSLVKSNGSLSPVDGLVTCGLTACTPGSAPGVGELYLYLLLLGLRKSSYSKFLTILMRNQ